MCGTDLSWPAVSHSCRVTVVEPTVKVFIWKSIPAGFQGFLTGFSHTENRVWVEAKLTHSGVHPLLRLAGAEATDEGGLPHSRAPQKDHLEHSLRTHTCFLQFRHKHPRYHWDFFYAFLGSQPFFPGIEDTHRLSLCLFSFLTSATVRRMGTLGLLQLFRCAQPSSETKNTHNISCCTTHAGSHDCGGKHKPGQWLVLHVATYDWALLLQSHFWSLKMFIWKVRQNKWKTLGFGNYTMF